MENNSLSRRLWWSHGRSVPATTEASDTWAVGDKIGVGQRRDLLNADGDGGSSSRGGGGGGGSGGGDVGERRARLAFLIMSSGDDILKLELLLPEISHPDNVYLVHVDAKTPQDQVS